MPFFPGSLKITEVGMRKAIGDTNRFTCLKNRSRNAFAWIEFDED
jgi:hypothetical protein